MGKLEKREKIILVIAALAILYAGYVYLIEPAMNKAKPGDQKPVISNQVSSAPVSAPASGAPVGTTPPAGSLKNEAAAGVADDAQDYIIARAEAGWGKNPFVDRKSNSYKEWASIQRAEAAKSSPEGKIVYSGYVDAGIRKIAIIDGLEYQAGDQLEMEGYVLKQVTPFQVLILNKNTGIESEIPISE